MLSARRGWGAGRGRGPARSWRRLRASVRPCWESLEVGGAVRLGFFFFSFVFIIYLFLDGSGQPRSSLVAVEWRFCAPAGSFDFWSFRGGGAEGGTIHRFRKQRWARVLGRAPSAVGEWAILQTFKVERWPSGSFRSLFKLLGFLWPFVSERACGFFFFFFFFSLEEGVFFLSEPPCVGVLSSPRGFQ